MTFLRWNRLPALGAGLLLLACGGDGGGGTGPCTPGPATQLAKNGGDAQSWYVNNPLPTPLSVIVRDANNCPVPSVGVDWSAQHHELCRYRDDGGQRRCDLAAGSSSWQRGLAIAGFHRHCRRATNVRRRGCEGQLLQPSNGRRTGGWHCYLDVRRCRRTHRDIHGRPRLWDAAGQRYLRSRDVHTCGNQELLLQSPWKHDRDDQGGALNKREQGAGACGPASQRCSFTR